MALSAKIPTNLCIALDMYSYNRLSLHNISPVSSWFTFYVDIARIFGEAYDHDFVTLAQLWCHNVYLERN